MGFIKSFNERDLADLSDGAFTENDVILKPTMYDHGCKTKHPLSDGLVQFYKSSVNLDLQVDLNHIEHGLAKPQRIQEAFMRLFVKDKKHFDAARFAFRRYCRKITNLRSEEQEEAVLAMTTSPAPQEYTPYLGN